MHLFILWYPSIFLYVLYTVKTAVLFWHKIGHIWYYVTKKNREKQKDGIKFDPFVCWSNTAVLTVYIQNLHALLHSLGNSAYTMNVRKKSY